jgi:hypothetical protein
VKEQNAEKLLFFFESADGCFFFVCVKEQNAENLAGQMVP